MANLTDASTFSPVYQLETTDRVLAGPGGIANRQAQELANRTLYLKNALEALDGSGGPFDYDASSGAVPAPGTGSGVAGAIKRKDQFVVSVAGTVGGVPLQVGDSLLAKQDLPTLISHYVVVQGNTVLATPTVLGLVKLVQDITGGPAVDAVLSVTGLINLFATLASPAFTGNPTAPTQAAGNNTTRLANTAFVTAADAVEAAARVAADNALQVSINAEISNRNIAVGNEASARASGDSNLQVNIDAANTARSAADATLQNNIDAANTARANADAAEALARANADAALQAAINALSVKVLGAKIDSGVKTNEFYVTDAMLPGCKIGFWCHFTLDATAAGDVPLITYRLPTLSGENIVRDTDSGYAANFNLSEGSFFCPKPPGVDGQFSLGHYIGSTGNYRVEIVAYI